MEFSIFLFETEMSMEFLGEFALRTFDGDDTALVSDGDTSRDSDRFSSDSGHDVPPYQT